MIKTIHVEPIKFREKYLSTPLLTKAEVEKAMDYVVAQTRANMDYFGTKFPWSATKGLKYPIIENIEWTDGFWTGLLWLCYEYTGDEAFRIRAEENIDSFLHRVENRIELDHHPREEVEDHQADHLHHDPGHRPVHPGHPGLIAGNNRILCL